MSITSQELEMACQRSYREGWEAAMASLAPTVKSQGEAISRALESLKELEKALVD